MNTSDVTIESKINVPIDTLIKALVEAHINVSINSLIKALTNANINIVNEKSVDISKNIPVVLKTEIANDIDPKINYVDVSTGISPPSSEISNDNSYLLSQIPQEESSYELSNVIEEVLNYIKNRQESLIEPEEPLVETSMEPLVKQQEPKIEQQEPLMEPLVKQQEPKIEPEEPLVEPLMEPLIEPNEDKPSESIKKPFIEIPSPKTFEPLPQIPPTPIAIQSRVYYQPFLVPHPLPPHPLLPQQILHYHHYILMPIIQPIIQYIPQHF